MSDAWSIWYNMQKEKERKDLKSFYNWVKEKHPEIEGEWLKKDEREGGTFGRNFLAGMR